MSSQHKSSSSSEKKPSLPVRVIRWTMFQVVSFVLAVLILGIGYAAVTWTNIPSGSGASGQPVNQTLVQGIINNINYLSGITSTLNATVTAVNTQLNTVNPSGTTLSGSSVCIGGICKSGWTTQLGDIMYGKSLTFDNAGTHMDQYGAVSNLQRWNDIIWYQAYNSNGYGHRAGGGGFDQANADYAWSICQLDPNTLFPSTYSNISQEQLITCGNLICEFYTGRLPFLSAMIGICAAGNPHCNNNNFVIGWNCLSK